MELLKWDDKNPWPEVRINVNKNECTYYFKYYLQILFFLDDGHGRREI